MKILYFEAIDIFRGSATFVLGARAPDDADIADVLAAALEDWYNVTVLAPCEVIEFKRASWLDVSDNFDPFIYVNSGIIMVRKHSHGNFTHEVRVQLRYATPVLLLGLFLTLVYILIGPNSLGLPWLEAVAFLCLPAYGLMYYLFVRKVCARAQSMMIWETDYRSADEGRSDRRRL